MRTWAVLLPMMTWACQPILEDGSLVVEQMEITGVDGDAIFNEALEIEIHVYEVDSMGEQERFIGCAGDDTGLDVVDASDALYRLNAHFVPARGGDVTLRIQDISTDAVMFVVSEDDENPCPVEQDATRPTDVLFDDQDDFVARSGAVSLTELEDGVDLSFGQVLQLRLGVYPEAGTL